MSGGGIAARVARTLRPEILKGSAYHVPDKAGLIRLDAMENPYAWPDELRDAWLESLRGLGVNRYPDPEAGALKDRLRRVLDIPGEMALLLGNGSDELIQIIALAAARPGAVLLAPEPGFAMYRIIADVAGLEYAGVPLRADDFALDADAMLAAIRERRPALVFLAWPNNPTGNLFDTRAVEAIMDAAPGLVIVDEAYHAFAGASFVAHARERDNVVIMRTLSKLGLAGLRLGVLAGPSAWLDEFDKLRLPYNVSVLTQASVSFFLDHAEVLNAQVARIRADRDALCARLAALPGVRVWESHANFLLFRPERVPSGTVFAELRDRGVLIKDLDGTHPYLANCLRVTVGTAEESDAFLLALRDVLDTQGG
jgi:histidinol-phosphate aminotransferase